MIQEVSRPSDEDLIRQILAGSHEAFRELHYRYYVMVKKICSKIIKNEAIAEELTQDTFLKVLCELHNFGGGNFGGWLKSIARSLALNELRREKTEKKAFGSLVHPDVVQSSGAHDPAKNSQNKELKQSLLDALAELPELRRNCVLAFYAGYSYPEIAKMYHLTIGQVESHLRNGRRFLRNKLRRLR